MVRAVVATVVAAMALAGVADASAVRGDVSNAAYDPDLAMTFLHLAGAAYCPEQNIYGWNGTAHTPYVRGFQPERVLYNSRTDTQAYVGYLPSQNAVVLAYRGTVASSLKDWIEDLEAWTRKTDYPGCDNGCRVHAGFYDVYQDMNDEVQAALRAAMDAHSGSRLFITGHSLGAALAVLAASERYTIDQSQATVISFGQPRVGDAGFATFFSDTVVEEHYRAVHYEDIVPHVPPLALDFQHANTEVWYQEDGVSNYQVCDGSGEDPTCSDSVALPVSISDHLKYLGQDIGSSYC